MDRRGYIRAASRAGLPRRLPLSTELWERLPLDIWKRILREVREPALRNWGLLRPRRRTRWASRARWEFQQRGYATQVVELLVAMRQGTEPFPIISRFYAVYADERTPHPYLRDLNMHYEPIATIAPTSPAQELPPADLPPSPPPWPLGPLLLLEFSLLLRLIY